MAVCFISTFSGGEARRGAARANVEQRIYRFAIEHFETIKLLVSY